MLEVRKLELFDLGVTYSVFSSLMKVLYKMNCSSISLSSSNWTACHLIHVPTNVQQAVNGYIWKERRYFKSPKVCHHAEALNWKWFQ